ncbi:hypothetical protein predicted by Glimmer/Critica [Bdellovibrio bacteriovorus HD100]|uniref:Uncharacterized protein n=1 Tax=Bdellovibrio bacteriovorus (strain ATCC 15356 / DSM 50701 / NCIMB 9529 / HD100) TaxID=264462 RepID=Q6MMI7_BDEBA|nr:hypothetical protein predicted by Glimmer/Critica [Bdellovibrio bacteriovorus HD100]
MFGAACAKNENNKMGNVATVVLNMRNLSVRLLNLLNVYCRITQL